MRAAEDPNYVEFIARLRRARRTKGWTQAHLAGHVGKPQSYISKVETCERRIDLIEAARLCLALGTTLAEMLPAELRSALMPQQRGNTDDE